MSNVRWALAGLVLCAACLRAGAGPATITLDDSVRFQTMKGWEAAILPTVRNDYVDDEPGFPSLFSQAARDLNVTRIRVDVFSGTEGRPGYGASYMSGAISESELVKNYAYDIRNDNDDPNVADLRGFDFTLLDWQFEHMVVPYKQQVEEAGGQLFVYLSYIDQNKSSFKHLGNPAEYAEFMLVLFDHLQARYGFVPNAIDVANESDYVVASNGTAMGRVVAATAARLDAAGFHPEFIGPSVVNRSHAVPFFDEMLAVPGVGDRVTELSYHCYYDSMGDSRESIGERVGRAGIGSTQNECWEDRNTHVELHRDLKAGRAAAWQQGTFNGSFYKVNRDSWEATLQERTRIKRQYYHYIKPGAVRIQADTTDDAMDPMAFIGPDGGWVVTVLARSGGSATIARLPAGTYGVSYSTGSEFDVQRPDVDVREGQNLSVSIPGEGVLTVWAKVPPAEQ